MAKEDITETTEMIGETVSRVAGIGIIGVGMQTGIHMAETGEEIGIEVEVVEEIIEEGIGEEEGMMMIMATQSLWVVVEEVHLRDG